MKTKSEILNNFFTDEEHGVLRELVEINRALPVGQSRFAPMTIESMSRVQIEFNLPKIIEDKLTDLAKKFINDPDLILTHYQYLDYYGQYGNGKSPNLPPHLDVENYYTKISIDYQMKSNIDWAIVVEGEKFILKDHEILVFEAGERIHWRDPIKLKEDDRCEVIVFHFSNKQDHEPYKDKQMDLEEREQILEKHRNMPRMQKYREEFFKELDILNRNEENNGAR